MRALNWFRIADFGPRFFSKAQRPPSERVGGPRWQLVAEWLLVLLVFAIHAGWPVPDPNEPYYLGKAIHFWQPDWVQGDFFLDTADAHATFYFTFGWLALWFGPTALAWTGRLLTWSLLAWGWQRLSWSVVPRRWWAVLSATVLVACLENAHMAGEWMIGGVEGKSFAYVFVLLGLEAMARERWTKCWLLLGIASGFHVLVGGWAVVAVAIGWLLQGRYRASAAEHLPGLVGGGLIALLGLIPTLLLNRGTPPDIVSWANEIYVYVRLGHHLNPMVIPDWFIVRFVALTALWLLIWWLTAKSAKTISQRDASQMPIAGQPWAIHGFVAGAVIIAVVGAVIAWLQPGGPAWTASLLRFYWFRLSDVAVPMGVALGVVQLEFVTREMVVSQPTTGGPTVTVVRRWSWLRRGVIAMAVLSSAAYLVPRAGQITYMQAPRSFRASPSRSFADRAANFVAWRDICHQIAASEEIPTTARFLTPRLSQTFKWYAQRPEVANWKEIPQDAAGIVEWWRRMRKIHSYPGSWGRVYWYNSLARQGPRRLRGLAERYGADYAVTVASPTLPLPVVLRNNRYVVYRLDRPREKAEPRAQLHP